ncbi:MAG: ATP-binding protein [Leptospiraceae bacterium]|nr:ATP-binding protein [Leptospiraceae bacterium]
MLVLDDFGVQKETAWAMEKIYDLIDTRYENRRLTIVTSNKPMESLKEFSKIAFTHDYAK